MNDKQITRVEKSLSQELKVGVNGFVKYSDGFAFEVKTELEAYKAAYKYQHCKQVKVSAALNIGAWCVQVYK